MLDPVERAAYSANRGLDANRDGKITLADLHVVLERVAPRFADAFQRLARAVVRLPSPGPTWTDAARRAARSAHSLGGSWGAAFGAIVLLGGAALVLGRTP